EGLDLRLQVALRLARGVDDAVGLRLRLGDDHARLAARVLLHLLHEPLRGHERLLEHLLPLLQAARALLERLKLLLEQRVLLEQGLVVRGEVFQEGVDLLGVEAPEHLHGELLLTNIHRWEPHSPPPYPKRSTPQRRGEMPHWMRRGRRRGEMRGPPTSPGGRGPPPGRSTGPVPRRRNCTIGL